MTVKVDGVDIHYIQEGKGPDLVLVSGLMGSSRGFDFVMSPFAKTFRVTAIDLPGYGVSAKHPDGRRYSPQEHAKTVIGAMDKLGIKKAGIFGDSYGCAVCMVVAADYPKRVSFLILQGPMKLPLRLITRFSERIATKVVGKIQGANRVTYWARRLNPEFKHMSKEQHSNADERFKASHADAIVQSGYDLVNFDYSGYASRLKVPTLLIEGDNRLFASLSATKTINEAAPKSTVRVKKINGTHTLLQQKPEEIVQEVKDFYERVAQ